MTISNILIGLCVTIVVLFFLNHAFLAYNKNHPIIPYCVACHNSNSKQVKLASKGAGWMRQSGNIICFDHLFLDGSKMTSMFSSLSTSYKHLPPSDSICDMAIADLEHPTLTKYEYFCYHVGVILQKQHPQLLYGRHVCVDKHKTSKSKILFLSQGTYFVDAPLGKQVKLKDEPRMHWCGVGLLKMLGYYIRSDENCPIILFIDWRFVYDHLNLEIDRVCTDIKGNKMNRFNVVILKTEDRYYAVGPLGKKSSVFERVNSLFKSGIFS